MLTDHELRDIDKGFIVIRLICIGLLIALGVYVVVANVLGEGMINDPGDPDDVFLIVGYVLCAIGAMILVAVYFIRKSVSNHQSIISRIAGFFSMTDISTAIVSGGNPHSAIGRYTGGMLICFGLIEALGIYGLVLFILNGNFLDLYLLVGVAILAQLYFRPKKQELINMATQLKQEKQMQENRNVRSNKHECHQCAGNISDIDRFCPHCGQSLN